MGTVVSYGAIRLISWPDQPCVRGVFSAKGPDSFGGGAGYACLGDDYMEEEVQVCVQIEMGREEQGEGETHGKEQGEEQRVKERTTAHRG